MTDNNNPDLESRTGAEAIVETLEQSGVEMLFGYSGGGTGPLVSSMAKHGFPNMNGRTELSGAWMSYGYNRIRGRAASVCLFHCVGVLHTVPVVYAAKLDSTPLVVMDVNLDSSLDFREALQEGHEVYSALKPVSKFIRKVTRADDVPLVVRQAVLSASTGRPGPSVLDFGFQVLHGESTCKIEELTLPEPPGGNPEAISQAAGMIAEAERPVLIVGGGAQLADAGAEVKELAESFGITVCCTSWGGRGMMGDDHPLFAGAIGSFGWVSGNDIAQRSDLWVAIGTTFSQMTTGAWNLDKPEKVIQVDIDPGQLGKIFQPSLGITGDAKIVLRQLLAELRNTMKPAGDWRNGPAAKGIAEVKEKWFAYLDSYSKPEAKPIDQYYLISKVSEVMPDDTIVVGDSGGQAFMLYRSFHYKQTTPMVMGPRYMSMGAGLPAAMGAKLAAPERTVLCFHGDGGFYYDFMELSTLADKKIKVIIIIDNNHCLLANASSFKMLGVETPWADLPFTTDFVALAKALGIDGETVTEPDQIESALKNALAAEGSYLIDVHTDPETRIRRAIRDVIPILSDRQPEQGSHRHFSPPLKGSWPN